MNCPICASTLRIAQSYFESPKDTADVFNVQTLVCVNPECTNHEPNMNSPSKIVETVRNKLN